MSSLLETHILTRFTAGTSRETQSRRRASRAEKSSRTGQIELESELRVLLNYHLSLVRRSRRCTTRKCVSVGFDDVMKQGWLEGWGNFFLERYSLHMHYWRFAGVFVGVFWLRELYVLCVLWRKEDYECGMGGVYYLYMFIDCSWRLRCGLVCCLMCFQLEWALM